MTGILIDPLTGDLDIRCGTIGIGDNTAQVIEEIILSNRGEYKEHPLVGGELIKLSHGETARFWANRVRSMCEAMGVSVRRVSLDNNGKITVER